MILRPINGNLEISHSLVGGLEHEVFCPVVGDDDPIQQCPFGKNRFGPVWYTIYHHYLLLMG